MGIGFGEFIIVLLIAFIIVGPEDLPKVVRALARWIKAVRKLIKDVGGSFEEDLQPENFVRVKNSFAKEFEQADSELTRIQKQVLDTASQKEGMS